MNSHLSDNENIYFILRKSFFLICIFLLSIISIKAIAGAERPVAIVLKTSGITCLDLDGFCAPVLKGMYLYDMQVLDVQEGNIEIIDLLEKRFIYLTKGKHQIKTKDTVASRHSEVGNDGNIFDSSPRTTASLSTRSNQIEESLSCAISSTSYVDCEDELLQYLEESTDVTLKSDGIELPLYSNYKEMLEVVTIRGDGNILISDSSSCSLVSGDQVKLSGIKSVKFIFIKDGGYRSISLVELGDECLSGYESRKENLETLKAGLSEEDYEISKTVLLHHYQLYFDAEKELLQPQL